jgi:tetratricopeptide (TPR) repeat protein
VLRVCLRSKQFHHSNKTIGPKCVVPPPEPSGRFAKALYLFNQFLQESDLDAVRQCVDIYKALLAGSNASVLAHHSDGTAFQGELNEADCTMGSQRRYHILIQLAHTLQERYQYAGDACDLEYATRRGEEALEMCRAEHIVCPTVWVLYANILSTRFGTVTNSEELRVAEMLCQDVISLCMAAHPLNSAACHTLSRIYSQQFGQKGDEAIIEKAVCFQRLGLERLPETESHSRHRHLYRLAVALTERHLHGQHQDNDDILSVTSEAFRLCPPTHVDRWLVQSRMMWQMNFEYTRSAELKFLDRAIELGRQALKMGNSANPVRLASFLYRMADILRIRYIRAGTNDEDLEESVELNRKALQVTPPNQVNRWLYVTGLASVLVLQFRSDGNVSRLEEVSQLYHHASEIMSTKNPWWPDTISAWAHSLGLRFRETGDTSDLNRAIDLDKEAVTALHSSSINYSDSTLQLATHLCLRFEAFHDDNDLKKAMAVAEELLTSLPDGNMNRLEAIVILAKVRLLHAMYDKDSRGIDQAVEQLLSIKGQLSQSNLGPESLRTLAACYMAKFRRYSAVDAALRARDVMDEMLKSVNSDHYERFQCLIDAAKLYMERKTPYHDIDMALEYLSEALENTHRDVRSKIRGARDVLVNLEIEHHNLFTAPSSTSLKLLNIIEVAVLLLPRIAFFGIHPYARLQSLKQGRAISMTGASHALNLSLPEKALEIMEQGRAIFWIHTLRLRSSFDDVPGDLQDRLLSLARRLEKVANASEDSANQQRVDRELAQRRKESEEFNSLVEKVRFLPGLERFMLPDEYSTLKDVAKKGPVVVLVSSTLACHAIILRSSENAAIVPLKAVTDGWLVESASLWRSTVIEARSALRDGRKIVKSKTAPESSRMRAERILRLLWIDVVFPVIQALRAEVSLCTLYLDY